MPGLVRFRAGRDSHSKEWATRLASRTSLWGASFAIPTRPGEGESPNSITLYSPFVRLLSSGCFLRVLATSVAFHVPPTNATEVACTAFLAAGVAADFVLLEDLRPETLGIENDFDYFA